jgi:DNA polymerase
LLRLNEEGFKILFHVHDEVVLEADKSDADDILKRTTEIMSTAPDWIDLPLEAKGKVLDQYEK